MSIKQQLFSNCQEFVQNKLRIIESTIASNKSALNSETKSSAGDKHETARAMLQLEMEKAGQQLQVVNEMKEQLDKIDIDSKVQNVRLGSIVITNQVNYFIAVSVGKIMIENREFFAISLNSPIGKLLLGKESGDKVTFRNQKIKIKELL